MALVGPGKTTLTEEVLALDGKGLLPS
ncbi:hypothetical protein PAE0064a [Pyrobaculum aerophilum str. IM2]|uniref:Uncharacterized protein n=1 Tax=Pyrobaculum aerophilum (strain ATCC 51768 / DSM 7523 / JCM 9630 / CIP 104966 / NBRC 100827 / IM2) TaxID=178306 RepID=Q8ZZV3_PYRAE|nr:hypothetical protein PAE0064a [Pyrobaculum aerophilum str. IM2]